MKPWIGWAFAILGACLLFIGIVWAFEPEELVRSREVSFDCKTKPGFCEISQDDLAFLIAQNQFLGSAAQEFYKKLRQCQVVNGDRES